MKRRMSGVNGCEQRLTVTLCWKGGNNGIFSALITENATIHRCRATVVVNNSTLFGSAAAGRICMSVNLG